MIDLVLAAVRRIQDVHFFRSELTYQGELLAELRSMLPNAGLPGDAIIEQEYQKRLRDHGVNVRPDLIIHVPTPVLGNVRQDNFVVFELNYQAGPKEVAADFSNLDTIVAALNYPLAVFLNVASGQTQIKHYRGQFHDRLHCIAVRHSKGELEIRHAHFVGAEVSETLIV